MSDYYSLLFSPALWLLGLVLLKAKRCVSNWKKRCDRILYFSDFKGHTNGLFFEFKLLKTANIFKIQKITFMFDFINNNIPDERNSNY